MAVASTCYVSTGCNKTPHALDWGFCDIICFATCNSVGLYDEIRANGSGRVSCVLSGHSGRVNSVRWIRNRNQEPETELISTSTDGSAIVWRKISGESLVFKVQNHLKQHTASVTIADALYSDFDGDCRLIVATASVDSTIKIWNRNNNYSDQMECLQTIDCQRGFSLDVKFAFLPNVLIPLLACSMDNSTISLYIEQNRVFEKIHTLHGHEDWVRSMDFILIDNYLLLATGSQDTLIRLWKISPHICSDSDLVDSVKDLPENQEIRLKENIFSTISNGKTNSFAVTLEAILAGHENWVYGVHWSPKSKSVQTLKLASASMDKTMILWSFDESSELWLEDVRVGEIGGNTLGFYGNKFNPNGNSIIAHGYQGAFHLWHHNEKTNLWDPGLTVSGHFNEVCDLAWDPEGTYLLSVSLDQTTRLHAPWNRKTSDGKSLCTWHELARPQIHGHDIVCVAAISRFKFISGADEKVLRAFEAPKKFVDNFCRLCGLDVKVEYEKMNNVDLPEGAAVPALGLSNKAIFEVEKADNQETVNCFVPVDLQDPPKEETLLQNTLWPEVHKLYGHGFELFCVAANHKGTLVASACKASKVEHARIILWDVNTWTQITSLSSHILTVTSLSFSPDDKFLLSVSRDRTWSLFQEKNNEDGISFEKIASGDKRIHSRIIWTCAWSPDSKFFFTGSRDKKVIAWRRSDFVPMTPQLTMDDSVTALDVAPLIINGSFLVSIGLDNGAMFLYWFNFSSSSWILSHAFDKLHCHNLCVKKIRFNPNTSNQTLKMASCGSDFAVRVLSLDVEKLKLTFPNE